ncbi:hypothetical protein THAOC_35200, partial [Thalassiosira oceanica]
MVRRQQRRDNCLPFPTSSLPFPTSSLLFPTSSLPFPTSSLPFPQTLALTPTATPITSFIPGDRAGFFDTVKQVAAAEAPAPTASPFRFEFSAEAAEHNTTVLERYDFDLAKEFHDDMVYVIQYPFAKEIDEETRQSQLKAKMERVNHKSSLPLQALDGTQAPHPRVKHWDARNPSSSRTPERLQPTHESTARLLATYDLPILESNAERQQPTLASNPPSSRPIFESNVRTPATYLRVQSQTATSNLAPPSSSYFKSLSQTPERHLLSSEQAIQGLVGVFESNDGRPATYLRVECQNASNLSSSQTPEREQPSSTEFILLQVLESNAGTPPTFQRATYLSSSHLHLADKVSINFGEKNGEICNEEVAHYNRNPPNHTHTLLPLQHPPPQFWPPRLTPPPASTPKLIHRR